MAYSYGIPDGTYVGRPTTASCYEKDGRLILDVHFAVKDPNTGAWYKKDNGYDWEANKRHWLTSKDGGFNEATINGLKEWAKGWNPQTFNDFYWFQNPDANGTPFGNLSAVGEVELNFQTDGQGNQNIWVHDPNRQRGRKAYVPEGAQADSASLAAKWGAKAKALFAATPKKVATVAAPKAAQTDPAASAPSAGVSAPPAAPARPGAAPARPAAAPAPVRHVAKPFDFPQDANGAFSFFCARLEEHGEKYASAKHDGRWFEIYDSIASNPRDPQDPGKDPDELTQQEVERLFEAVDEAFAK